jgi:hypothetical protein
MGSARQRDFGDPRFRMAPNGGESTSFVILKALDYARRGAQIVNMSFAGRTTR